MTQSDADAQLTFDAVPLSKTLSRLVTLLGYCPSPQEYLHLGMRYIQPPQRHADPITWIFMDGLERFPAICEAQYMSTNLSLVRPDIYRCPLPCAPSTLNTTEALLGFVETYIPSTRWEAEGARGLLIRTYTAGDHRHFTHIRVLTRARMVPSRMGVSNQRYVGTQRQWHEFTSYKGWCVPYEVVLRVYELAAISPDWDTAAREINIPEEAWTVLDGWYTTVSAQEVGNVKHIEQGDHSPQD